MLKLLQILFSGAFQAGDMVTLTLALIPLLAALGKSGFNAANADCTDPEDCEDQNIASDNSQQQLAELELSYYNTKLLSETSAWTPSMMEIAIENLDRAGEQFYNQGRTIYLAIGGENIESYYDEKMIVVTIPVDIAYDQESFGASLQAEFGQLAQAINPGTSAMAN